LSGAVQQAGIIVTAGLAEIAAGSSPWAWRLPAAKSDAEHYASEERREQQEVRQLPRRR